MGTLLGFAIGYYLGSRTGPNAIDDMLKAWQTIKESEDYQALAATLSATLESVMHRGGEAAGKWIAGISSLGDEFGAEPIKETTGANGNLEGLWEKILAVGRDSGSGINRRRDGDAMAGAGGVRSSRTDSVTSTAVHELAITESVVAQVSQRVGDAKVTRVMLEIGKLSGVVCDSVRFCFDICAQDTPLEGARLEIIQSPGRARCRQCGASFEIEDLLALCQCGSMDFELIGGQELKIREVEIADV